MCDRIAGAGVPMAVVTNKAIEPTKRILTGLGLSDYFRVVLGGDSLPQRKPDPAPLLRALSLLGAEARRAIMVGDSEVDVEAARAAGVTVAAVTWGFVARQALESTSPGLLADNAAALTDWILE
jgi:phosphoglycolate phosphatase